jgi:hypothetical protein
MDTTTTTRRAGAVAPLRGVALAGLAVPHAALFSVTVTAIGVLPVGVGLLVLPPAILATRPRRGRRDHRARRDALRPGGRAWGQLFGKAFIPGHELCVLPLEYVPLHVSAGAV